ncbi:hypothetical protein GGF46_005258 [Coemansia sp. RSA 552]|nr:hypothetical protein GGF46_005258 [Coemansia sp. RSA 552]
MADSSSSSARTYSSTERRLLLGQQIDSGSEDNGSFAGLAGSLTSGDYEGVLRSVTARAVLGADLDEGLAGDLDIPSPFDPKFASKDVGPLVTALTRRYIEANGPSSWGQVTLVGVACMNGFIQTNWTGPELRLDPVDLLPKPLAERWAESYISIEAAELPEGVDKHEIGRREQMGRVFLGATQSEERSKLDRDLLRRLEVGGEEAYALAPRPLYLYLARLLLVDIPAACLGQRDEAMPSAQWWTARLLIMQQSLLDYPAQELMDQIIDCFVQARKYMPSSPAAGVLEAEGGCDEVQAVPGDDDMAIDDDVVPDEQDTAAGADDNAMPVFEDETAESGAWDSVSVEDRDLWARYLVEVGVMYSRHSMPLDAKRHFGLAQAASGLQWEMTGAKGRRTKFQTHDVVQLVLMAKSARRAEEEQSTAVPEAMALNNDVLLENIKFTDESKQEDLLTIDKCILLALCLNVGNESPAHGLTSEQMMPFVVRVLQHTGNWSVYTMGLLLRSRLESTKSRTVERATLQMQALVDQITHPLPEVNEAGAAERLQYLFALSLPSQWDMERELAKMFMSLGVLRSALDIFERLQMWDDVISCYRLLEQTDVAESIVRRELDSNPDRPKLWCLLGDLKQDPEHWRKAWEVSGQRYARAMRSLGAYHYQRNEFKDSVECYEHALRLNPLFENSWYVLGCGAMNTKAWDLATKAFLRVVSIDQNNGEAWNNLATVYLKRGPENRPRALHALREAVKYKRDSWQVWSNVMHVALSLGNVAMAIQAMGNIVDLRAAKDGASCVDLDMLRKIIGMLARGPLFDGLTEEEARRKELSLAGQMNRLLVGKIEARITSTAALWRAMADYWLWRRDYNHCLDCYIKAYRSLSQMPQVAYAPPVFNDAVEAALDLVSMYEELGTKGQVVRVSTTGDQELPGEDGGTEERKTSAVEQPVCADWKYKAKMVLRGLIGKTKQEFEGTAGYTRLTDALAELRQQA